jgi:hypothetical protein
MKHHARMDWCALAGSVAAIAAILLRASVWIAGPVLLILMLCAFPHSYETTENGLAVRGALSRRLIPYGAIREVGVSEGCVRVLHGRGSELAIAPRHRDRLIDDLEKRLPHLVRQGRSLVPRDRYVEYSFGTARGAWRTS